MEAPGASVEPGDFVVRVGSDDGVFLRYALAKGAGKAILIDEDPGRTACLAWRFRDAIEAGRLEVVRPSDLDSPEALGVFAARLEARERSAAPTLDEMLPLLGLRRVDFLAIDAPGRTLAVLEGAKGTIEHFAPRLAIRTNSAEADGVERAVRRLGRPYEAVRRGDMLFFR